MEIKKLHSFDVHIQEAREIQRRLRDMIVLKSPRAEFTLVAGADVSFPGSIRGRGTNRARAGVVVLDAETLETVEESVTEVECRFPYVPGFLIFREGPAVLEAFQKLKHAPDLVVFDAQGIAHPRGLGLASHLGLFLDLPSIGCAKSRLVGESAEPGPNRGDSSTLYFEGRDVGRVLRTKPGVKPVFVSPGHRMDQETAARVVLGLVTRFRLPEPTRRAHRLVTTGKT
ncbi:MAG: deoxyribonuclease V [bacterium]|nr:deoxyribonuclease V [bacterium]